MPIIEDTDMSVVANRALCESDTKELIRHRAELGELIELCRGKLDEIAKVEGKQRLLQEDNMIISQPYTEQGYMRESRMQLAAFSDQVNVEIDSLLCEYNHSLATDHSGSLAILDDNCLDTVFGYFNAETMGRFSQTNCINSKLMNRIATKCVNKAPYRKLVPQHTAIRQLQKIERMTVSLFGFDFVDDMAGAEISARRENPACFTKFYDPIKDRAGFVGPFIHSNFLRGKSHQLDKDRMAGAICGDLPLTCGDEHFLIVTLHEMTYVGPFTFGLVSSECCPKSLASSPEDNFCASFKLWLPDDGWDESKVVLGIKFDSKANLLTHSYISGESLTDEEQSYFFANSDERNWKVVHGTVDVVNAGAASLFWALQFSTADDAKYLPHLVGVRDATRDEFERLHQKILSYDI